MRKSKLPIVAIVGSVILATSFPNASQSQGLTTEAVSHAFVEGVGICARALIAGKPIAAMGEADNSKLKPADAQERSFNRVPEGRPAYSVLLGAGIVSISEPEDGKCDVMAYGPRILPVFSKVKTELESPTSGFVETSSENTPEAFIRVYERNASDTKSVRISLDGGEPGMANRRFRFPLMFANGTTHAK